MEGKQKKCGAGSSFDCRGGGNNINVVVVGGGGDCGGDLSGRKKRRLTELKRSKITNCREEGRELALVKKNVLGARKS